MSAVNKWSPTDPRHFAGMSTSDLRRELERAVAFSKKYPQFQHGWYNEYIQELRRHIAESIGMKKK
jgi:hypothetical protein